ncbi:MAG: GNAT family N-acetyltransferase [Ruminococcus sp.]|jgi:GNAT superfamily N-acetyltransferase|nr:GNAT family N-acetyltransferase [Ruminococcus sp.]
MRYVYTKADIGDIELLVRSRVMVLKAANKLPDDADMSEIERQSREYYKRALADGSHTAYLVFDGQRLIGTGGMSYYSVMPTCDVTSGKKAYVMNMYTDPEYRRQGIAYRTLELLVQDAKARGVEHITLEATDMGRPLYEKYGFVQMQSEMQLKNAAQCTEKKCRCCR